MVNFAKFLYLFTVVLILLFITGCYSIIARKEFKDKLKTCYSGEQSLNVNVQIDLDGYYLMYERGDFSFGPPNTPYHYTYDSLPINIFFFKDGIFLYNFLLLDESPQSIQNYFNNIYDTTLDTIEHFKSASWCGSYNIYNDTLKAQFFFIGGFNAGWFGRELWYKIVDSQTIKSIYAYPIPADVSEEQLQQYWYNNDRYSPGHLVPLQKLPSSDCWLKKEKWFWCDENQWRAYMESNGFKIKRKDRKPK